MRVPETAMKNRHTIALSLLLLCLFTLPAWPQSNAKAEQAPVVRKIEPPNWWVNYTPSLTLLLTGENLSGARVESPTKGLTPLGTEASANGHYLFVHLQLSSDLPSGTVPLHLITAAGSTTVSLAAAGARGLPRPFRRHFPRRRHLPDHARPLRRRRSLER